MPYSATALNVLIASPGDVARERNIIRNAVYEWNAIHSKSQNIILTPMGWESHSYPEAGDRPQAIINRQLLDECDLLIAVFWTRIGSPTGESESGTVEEIEKHVNSGKPAMIYFSTAPVQLDSVDEKQYASLRAFKTEFKDKGLYETYVSLEDFREKVSRQLAQRIISAFGHLAPQKNIRSDSPRVKNSPQLSEAARQILVEVAKDRSGTLLMVRTFGGLIVQTNGKQLSTSADGRSEARWKGAIDELVGQGLLESAGAKGEVFRLTHRGYSMADELGVEAAPV